MRDTQQEAQVELARITDVRSGQEAYASYQGFVAGSQLKSQVSQEYSVSNRGLRAWLVGTPKQNTERLRAYEQAGMAGTTPRLKPLALPGVFDQDIGGGASAPRWRSARCQHGCG